MTSKKRATFSGAAISLILALLMLGGCSNENKLPEGVGDATSLMRARLMTGPQYSASLAQLFGQDVADSVVSPLPPLTREGDGLLASDAASIGLTPDQLSQVAIAARTVAEKVVDEDHRDYLISCKPADAKASDEACATEFLKSTGQLWFHRPVETSDLDRLVALASSAADELEDFYAGLSLALEGLLVSPQGVFIIDRAEPDPERPGELRLDSYSIASRLSFFLWNAPPDQALLDAAASGKLDTPQGRAEIADTMLTSPRLENGTRAFFDDMLHFNDFDSLAKDAEVYPAATGAALADAREQTLRTIYDQLIVKNGDYRDLFTSRETFLSRNLATLYGVPASDGWQPYTVPPNNPRQGGLLTQISFLAAHSHPATSSPTRRGKAMRELFLCQVVPDPPPTVNFSELGEVGEGQHTKREQLVAHNENPACAGCHKLMDPIGLALEHFDGAGEYRKTDDGLTIDTTGELDGITYDDSRGLGAAVRDHSALPSCLVTRVYAYGTGGPSAGRRDWPTTDYLTDLFAAQGYRWPDLLRSVILSPAFTNVRLSKEPVRPENTTADTTKVSPAADILDQNRQSTHVAGTAAYSTN